MHFTSPSLSQMREVAICCCWRYRVLGSVRLWSLWICQLFSLGMHCSSPNSCLLKWSLQTIAWHSKLFYCHCHCQPLHSAYKMPIPPMLVHPPCMIHLILQEWCSWPVSVAPVHRNALPVKENSPQSLQLLILEMWVLDYQPNVHAPWHLFLYQECQLSLSFNFLQLSLPRMTTFSILHCQLRTHIQIFSALL